MARTLSTKRVYDAQIQLADGHWLSVDTGGYDTRSEAVDVADAVSKRNQGIRAWRVLQTKTIVAVVAERAW